VYCSGDYHRRYDMRLIYTILLVGTLAGSHVAQVICEEEETEEVEEEEEEEEEECDQVHSCKWESVCDENPPGTCWIKDVCKYRTPTEC
jgi:hypothetical protein